jgi:hypothetical protein
VDALILGYKDQLAREHLVITKRLIKANLWGPKTSSESDWMNRDRVRASLT